jgi:hypothetical protein
MMITGKVGRAYFATMRIRICEQIKILISGMNGTRRRSDGRSDQSDLREFKRPPVVSTYRAERRQCAHHRDRASITPCEQ